MFTNCKTEKLGAVTQELPAGPACYFFNFHPGQRQGMSDRNGSDPNPDGGGRGDDLGD